jgi:hypothetical protein
VETFLVESLCSLNNFEMHVCVGNEMDDVPRCRNPNVYTGPKAVNSNIHFYSYYVQFSDEQQIRCFMCRLVVTCLAPFYVLYYFSYIMRC